MRAFTPTVLRAQLEHHLDAVRLHQLQAPQAGAAGHFGAARPLPLGQRQHIEQLGKGGLAQTLRLTNGQDPWGRQRTLAAGEGSKLLLELPCQSPPLPRASPKQVGFPFSQWSCCTSKSRPVSISRLSSSRAALAAAIGASYAHSMLTMHGSPVLSDPEIMGGTLVFVGTRVSAQTLLDYLDDGYSFDAFFDDYPGVEREDAAAFLKLARGLVAPAA